MEEIGYHNWGFIPADPDPTTLLEPYMPNPPMLTTLALDPGASLVFLLRLQPSSLQVVFEVTAVSAERHSANLFKVFTGTSGTEFAEIQHQGWEKESDGMYATFTTLVDNVKPYVKFLTTEDPPLIINRVTFTG